MVDERGVAGDDVERVGVEHHRAFDCLDEGFERSAGGVVGTDAWSGADGGVVEARSHVGDDILVLVGKEKCLGHRRLEHRKPQRAEWTVSLPTPARRAPRAASTAAPIMP